LELCLRFGWPVVALPLTIVPEFFVPSGFGLCAGLLTLIAMPVNGLIQAGVIAGRRVPPAYQHRSFWYRMRMLGRFAIILLWMSLILPALVFGGCIAALLMPYAFGW
jgi:hypothetical protein